MTPGAEPSGPPTTSSQVEDRPEPPGAVAKLAAWRQLGQLVDARVVLGAWTIGRMAVIIAAVSIVPFFAMYLGDHVILMIVGLLGLLGILAALVCAAYAVKTAVAGSDDWYLYANGVVAQRRRQRRAVTWPEVATVSRKRMGNRASRRGSLVTPETLRGYELGLHDGASIFLTASDMLDQGKLLGVRLEQQASQAGVPVTG